MAGYSIDASLNDGDVCFQGPLVIATGQGTRALFTAAPPGDSVGVYLWHPALPAVARWLADHPEARWDLEFVAGEALHALTSVHAPQSCFAKLNTLYHLIDALSGHGKDR